jgi:hypothetical protein
VAHHFSSGKPAAYCSCIRVESYSMFDVSSLAFRDQFEAAVVVSGVCLAAAVVLREWFTDREIRIIARILGAAGWAVVVTFAWRMTVTNETLATQLMVKGKTDATSIADPVRVVAVESEYTTTVGNQKFSIVRYSDGQYGSVSRAAECEDRIGAGCSTEIRGVSGGDDFGLRASDDLGTVRNGLGRRL